MSMLANVTKGKRVRPALILVYGPGGIGKSSFGARTPNPLFLGAEEGTDHLDVARLPTPKSYEDVIACVNELLSVNHNYQTLVVDSLDWIEPLIFDYVCRRHSVKSIELAAGGYGKGYTEAATLWAHFRLLLTSLRDRKAMNIVLLAHPAIVKITNPQTQTSYERYEMKLHKQSKAHFMEYVDAMFFASYAFYTKREGDQLKVFSTEQRVLHPNWKDGFDAKNRYGLTEPLDLGIPWDQFIQLCSIGSQPVVMDQKEVLFHVQQLLAKTKDKEIIAKAKTIMDQNDYSSLMKLKLDLEKIESAQN